MSSELTLNCAVISRPRGVGSVCAGGWEGPPPKQERGSLRAHGELDPWAQWGVGKGKATTEQRPGEPGWCVNSDARGWAEGGLLDLFLCSYMSHLFRGLEAASGILGKDGDRQGGRWKAVVLVEHGQSLRYTRRPLSVVVKQQSRSPPPSLPPAVSSNRIKIPKFGLECPHGIQSAVWEWISSLVPASPRQGKTRPPTHPTSLSLQDLWSLAQRAGRLSNVALR